MIRWLALTALMLAGCSESVDTAGLPSAADYDQWHRVDVTGAAPGHGDTYRIIYVNDVGREYVGGRYAPGTVLVKEIRSLTGEGGPGDLDYIAIMRKLLPDADVPLDHDWLFSRAETPGGDETHDGFCYGSCHAQAPVDSAWYDYGR
jgi:hypothetical protein